MVQKDAETLFRSTDTSCIGELRSIGTFFSLSYVPGSYSSHDVEEYHFIRAPCAAIKHIYEAYRNFMKSGIESVWAHNDENNKDAASRNLSISDSLNVYFVHQNMYIIITILLRYFSNPEQKFRNEFLRNSSSKKLSIVWMKRMRLQFSFFKEKYRKDRSFNARPPYL